MVVAFLLLAVGFLASLWACGSAPPEASEPPDLGPRILALSSYAASIGTPIDVYATGLPTTGAARLHLRFEGTFDGEATGSQPVNVALAAKRVDARTIKWGSFGPFGNPFTPPGAPDVGVFNGTVRAELEGPTGAITEKGPPLAIAFRVLPSIVIEDFQPVTADCAAPAKRAFGGFRYRLRTRAIGFHAKSIQYRLTVPATNVDSSGQWHLTTDSGGQSQPVTKDVVHAVKGDTDNLGANEAFALPVIPEELESYTAVINVNATEDKTGAVYKSQFAIPAQWPIDVVYDGQVQLAEVKAPTPVSACIPGGTNGRLVQYTEAQTETRARTLSIVMNENWLSTVSSSTATTTLNTWSTADGTNWSRARTKTDGTEHTVGTSNTDGGSSTNSFSIGYENSNTVGRSDNNGGNWNLKGEVSPGIGGKVGLPFVGEVNGKLGGTFGGNGGQTWGTTTSDAGTNSTNGSEAGSSTSGSSSTNVDSTNTIDTTANTDTDGGSSVITKNGGTTDTKTGGDSQANGGSRANGSEWTVSSADAIARGFGGNVVAGTYGVFYRQTVRYQRRASVVLYNKCGDGDVVGEVTRDEWSWAPDLAQSPSCPPLPASNLPPAQCLVQPCE